MTSTASRETLPELARRVGGFDVFLGMLARAGLTDTLSGPGKYTLFAPDDDSFTKFPKSTLAKLGSSEHAELMKAVVSMHLVVGQVLAGRVEGRRIRGKSVQGGELVISGAGIMTVNGANVVRPDLMACNGVIHGIDKVLWPKFTPGESELAVGG